MPGARRAASEGLGPASGPAITLRRACGADQAFIARIYARAMGPLLARAGMGHQAQAELLAAQWNLAEMRIIAAAEREVGWVQTAVGPRLVFLRNICIDPDYQRLGIGTVVLQGVMRDAGSAAQAVSLAVAKGNPARRLYERFGFRVTHDDAQHHYMRWDAPSA